MKQPPSSTHWLGTDQLGRDIFSRFVYGSRVSVEVGIVAVLISLLIGLFFGALAGYFGGWGDSVIMRSADVFFAFPTVLGAIVIMTGPRAGPDQRVHRHRRAGVGHHSQDLPRLHPLG